MNIYTWSRYLHWWQRWKSAEEGAEWERLVDRRIPPRAVIMPAEVKSAAVVLRRVDPDIDCETARKHLVDQFGERGDLSDSALRREWSKKGLTQPGQGDASRFEKVERFNGGGGLALIGAAAAETGIAETLALAAQEAGRSNASAQEVLTPKSRFDGRDREMTFLAVPAGGVFSISDIILKPPPPVPQ